MIVFLDGITTDEVVYDTGYVFNFLILMNLCTHIGLLLVDYVKGCKQKCKKRRQAKAAAKLAEQKAEQEFDRIMFNSATQNHNTSKKRRKSVRKQIKLNRTHTFKQPEVNETPLAEMSLESAISIPSLGFTQESERAVEQTGLTMRTTRPTQRAADGPSQSVQNLARANPIKSKAAQNAERVILI